MRTSIIGNAIAGQMIELIDWFISQFGRTKECTKAVYPINAMGMYKLMIEKGMVLKSRNLSSIKR